MAKIDAKTGQKIQELQILEQSMQNLVLQKQAFQLELNETENAIEETKKAKGDVYKIVGQVMLKSEKKEIDKELNDKKKILQLRINALGKQENSIREKMESLRSEIVSKIEKSEKK